MRIEVTLEEFNSICWEQFNQYSEQWRQVDIDPEFSRVIQEEFWNIL